METSFFQKNTSIGQAIHGYMEINRQYPCPYVHEAMERGIVVGAMFSLNSFTISFLFWRRIIRCSHLGGDAFKCRCSNDCLFIIFFGCMETGYTGVKWEGD